MVLWWLYIPYIYYLLLVIIVFFTQTESTSRDGWGPWTDWSICSVSCDQGLVYSQRTCHRLDRHNSCSGHSKRFKICNLGKCADLPTDPTWEECKRQSKIYYGGKRFYWEPYINPRTPCELSCKARGHHYVYNIKKLAKDGADCTIKHKAVCLAGRCMQVGCDGIVRSYAKVDRCGICNGNGNSCRLTSGFFSKPYLAKYGYNHVITIPADARSINISELASSRNFLALKSGGKYFINGNRRLHRTGSYQIAGTTFIYGRRSGRDCPGECLSSPGPTNQSVQIEILYYHKNSGVKYHYTMPYNKQRLQGVGDSHLGVPLTNDGLSSLNDLSKEGIPLNKLYVPGGVPLSKPLIRNSADNRLIIRNRVREGEVIKNSYGNQYPRYIPNRFDTNQPFTSQVEPDNTIEDGTGTNFEKKHYIHTNTYDKQAVRSSYGSRLINDSIVSNGLTVRGLPTITTSMKESNSVYTSDTRYDKSGLYLWSISGFTDCSEKCGGGMQETQVICLKGKSQIVVTNDNCDMKNKPSVQRIVCNTKPCSADWFTGNWSLCSVSCNKGTHSRLVECRRRISPTLILSVSADLCVDKPKPQRIKPCQIEPCIRWKQGNWTKCSTDCGYGQRTRPATCINGEGLAIDDKRCTSPKPKIEEICDLGSCVKGWYHTKWSKKCSRDCGKGIITRDIFCSADDGNHLPDKSCSPAEKPTRRKTCINDKPCGGFWFVGPWNECNATCGYGVRIRGVACMRELRHNVYTTTNFIKCLQEKPHTEDVCAGLPPCKPKWYITSWGKCTKTCGTGVRKREVKCLNSELEPDMTCQKKKRPTERQSCNKESCEEINFNLQKDSSGDICSDTYVHWCGFVKQARICGYKYYKKLCCKSCSILS